MKRPSPDSRSAGHACSASTNGLVSISASICCHCSTGNCSTGATCWTPALATITSRRPKRSSAVSTATSLAVGSVRSAWCGMPGPSGSGRTSTASTSTPSALRRAAIARPMPLPAPVTNAALPLSTSGTLGKDEDPHNARNREPAVPRLRVIPQELRRDGEPPPYARAMTTLGDAAPRAALGPSSDSDAVQAIIGRVVAQLETIARRLVLRYQEEIADYRLATDERAARGRASGHARRAARDRGGPGGRPSPLHRTSSRSYEPARPAAFISRSRWSRSCTPFGCRGARCGRPSWQCTDHDVAAERRGGADDRRSAARAPRPAVDRGGAGLHDRAAQRVDRPGAAAP